MAAAVVFVVVSNLTPISESDFWIQAEVGDRIRETGMIPRTIEFAFTEARDAEFVAHEWLPSALSSALYAHVGYRGMIVFKCVLALGVTALAFALAFRIDRNLVVSVLIACAVATAMNFRFQMRPEIFAFLLALASLHLLVAFTTTGRRAWLLGLLPVAVVWANSHGSFLLNLALPWMFLAGAVLDDARGGSFADATARRDRLVRTYLPLAAAGVASLLLSLANPYGSRLFTHAFSFTGAAWLREHIVEFGATFDPRVRAQPYFLIHAAFAAVVLVSFVVGRRRIAGTPVVLAVVFGWMSTDAIRFTAWFALFGTYVLAHNLADPGRARRGERSVALAGLAVLAVGIGVVALRGDVRGHRIGFRNEAPMSEAALDFVRTSGIEETCSTRSATATS